MSFGNSNGPIYPLGKLTVAVVGTVVPLNTNVAITDQSGTPSGGIPPQSSKGSPAPLKCNEIKVQTPVANTGNIFLVFKSGTAAGANGTAVVLLVQPGQERSIQSQLANAPYEVDQFALDTDVAGSIAYVTLII